MLYSSESLKLTCLGSKLGRPHTDSTSTKSTSSGKEQLALPSPEKQSPMQEACEVEEYVEGEMELV